MIEKKFRSERHNGETYQTQSDDDDNASGVSFNMM